MVCLELSAAAAREFTEEARLQAVHATKLLDTAREPEFDDLAVLAAAMCATPIAAMSLLDERRLWFKAIVGVDLEETPRELSLCDHAIRQTELFVVEDARADARFSANPLVVMEGGVVFYAGMPLRTRDGHALGTLCVIDQQPRKLTAQQSSGLKVLARQIMA